MAVRNKLIVVANDETRETPRGKIKYRRATKNGKLVQLRVIDADGADFTAQLTDAFRSSVRKARAENRQLEETR